MEIEQKRTAGRQAHLYALLSWYGANSVEEAEKMVDELTYEELDGKSYAESSIKAAISGIESEIFNEQLSIAPETDLSKHKLLNDPAVYDVIVEIVADIHDKWVKDNAKKYDRGNEEKSLKNLFQHTPTAMIGLDEVAKDLMFLAPFLDELGLDVGKFQMQVGGSFVPSQQFANAYQRYVEDYKNKNKIKSNADLERNIRDCIDGKYAPLAATTEMAEKRSEYMKEHIDTLLASVKSKNEKSFCSFRDDIQRDVTHTADKVSVSLNDNAKTKENKLEK